MPQNTGGEMIPSPGERLEDLIHHLWCRLQVPHVGIGGFGPRTLQARPRVGDPELAHSALHDDAWKVIDKLDSGWLRNLPRNPDGPVADDIPPCPPLPELWHPKRRPAARMMASYARRIRGKSDEEIADLFGLSGETISHASGITRFKTVSPLVQGGDVDWMRLGAWPWAAFAVPASRRGEDPEEFMPNDWWTADNARDELETILAAMGSRASNDKADLLHQMKLAEGDEALSERAVRALRKSA
jgi:hypothetical protein